MTAVAPMAEPPPEPHWIHEWWPQVLFAVGILAWLARRGWDFLVVGPRGEQRRLADEVGALRGAVERACTTADNQAQRLDRHTTELRSMSERIDRLIDGLLER